MCKRNVPDDIFSGKDLAEGSSQIGFLGAHRAGFAHPRFGMAIIAVIVVGFIAAHTTIG